MELHTYSSGVFHFAGESYSDDGFLYAKHSSLVSFFLLLDLLHMMRYNVFSLVSWCQWVNRWLALVHEAENKVIAYLVECRRNNQLDSNNSHNDDGEDDDDYKRIFLNISWS